MVGGAVGLVLVAVLLLVLAVPTLLIVVVTGAAMGALVGVPLALALALRRHGRIPRGSAKRATPGRNLLVGALLVIVVVSLGLASNTVLNSINRGLDPLPADLVPARYTATWDAGDGTEAHGWSVSETLHVPRSELTQRLRPIHKRAKLDGALGGDWIFMRKPSTRKLLVFERTTGAPLKLPRYPFVTRADLQLPHPTIRGSRAAVVPAKGSELTLSGPLRFIYDTKPPESARDPFGSQEDVYVKTDDVLAAPRAIFVQVQLANRMGRWEPFKLIYDAGFWPPVIWLLGVAASAAVGTLVTLRLTARLAKHAAGPA